MIKPLLIGTANPKKAHELALLLSGLPWKVVSLDEYPALPAPEENGGTFEENAIIKARYYSEAFKIACISDDSGLMVDALGGAPGVYSARYAGEQGNDAANIEKLLQELSNHPWHERAAKFICCAAFYQADTDIHIETGEICGHISVTPYGNNGFGYDPVFVPEGDEITFAEMTADAKHAISHRGRAFSKLRDWLEKQS